MTKTLTKSDLAEFSGTENIYRHNLVRTIVYTDGVRHVAQAGEAYWLIDKITCAQIEKRHAEQAFQRWSLTVHANKTSTLICTDGNSNVIFEETISYTDFPLESIAFYVTDHTILLPSEY